MQVDPTSWLNAGINEVQTGIPGGEMGKDQFMQLLIAQMQNQDPMEPVDNAAMTAQLAQFSSLEQMTNLNGKFEMFQQSSTTAMSLMNAGKPVTLELIDGSSVSGTLDKVQFDRGETQFVVGGEVYPVSIVRSLIAGDATIPELPPGCPQPEGEL